MSDYRVGIGFDHHGGTHGFPVIPLLDARARSGEGWGFARAKPGSAQVRPHPTRPCDA